MVPFCLKGDPEEHFTEGVQLTLIIIMYQVHQWCEYTDDSSSCNGFITPDNLSNVGNYNSSPVLLYHKAPCKILDV